MSLEQAIQENTAAIRELIASLKGGNVVTGDANARVVVTDEMVKAKREEIEPQTPATEPAATEPAVVEQEQPSPEPQTVDLKKDVAPVFLKLCVAKGRDAGASVLAKYKAEKLSDIPADKLVDVLADIQKAAA